MYKLENYPEFVSEYFTIQGKSLHRILANGRLKPLKLSDRGRLICNFAGEIYKVVDLAWTLLYGVFPKYDIICIDGDQTNLTIENLAPVRSVRHRCYPLQSLQGWKHKLSANYHSSEAACVHDWQICARELYTSDRLIVAREEANRLELLLSQGKRTKPADFPPAFVPKARKAFKGRRPSPNHVWHKETQQWVEIPPPCCIADDHQARCAYVLQGYSEFAYDSELQQVRPKK